MYSTRVIEANVAAYESKAGHKLIRIEPGKRDDWRAHLDSRLARAGSQDELNKSLAQEELLFIRNERVLSALDFSYWSHYATIQRDGGGITNFDHPWESTQILLKLVAKIQEEQYDAVER